MKEKIVYQCDDDGWFVGITTADESPEEPGIFHIPRNAYEDAPPVFKPGEGERVRRVATGWEIVKPETTPTTPEQPKAAPTTCTPAQGLVALFAIKRITEDDVLAKIASIPDEVQRYTVKIGYQRATTWERGSPAMQTMAQLLQLSDSDLDELFTYAKGVAV
ncbi:hypothetical protein N5D77_26485 [Comamonas thiooxydans]|uniref:Uncharacterized protein n=1 Tax=Comamonas thiooxydans TaxID=363952 RepID=A0AA42TXQ9_9BURK|nr:hypothetical protein [Comamonas thiooxydans]MDH1337608.1 hypothetical protein [Comamonas thiooxydans]MDH1743802.1 hypothetical protein [Comamonas thiooxydans]MDH1790101.1 hypothetical protein [Comamonas thiooxydans]